MPIRQKYIKAEPVASYIDGMAGRLTEDPVSYGDASDNWDNVNTELLNSMTPDQRGHYSDIVKLSNHPTSHARGTFMGEHSDGRADYFDLNERGMDDPNYTIFGMLDNGDGGSGLMYDGSNVIPEVTATPSGNYIDDTYNKERWHIRAAGGSLQDSDIMPWDSESAYIPHAYDDGGYMDDGYDDSYSTPDYAQNDAAYPQAGYGYTADEQTEAPVQSTPSSQALDAAIAQQQQAGKTPWDMLSMEEKSSIIKEAVSRGIKDLNTIRDMYNSAVMGQNKDGLDAYDNSSTDYTGDSDYDDTDYSAYGSDVDQGYEYADGGHLYGSGGHYWPSESIRNDIRMWEGESMKTNRTFGAEARDFNRVIPASVRAHLNQRQLDALYSYGYNVGMGNLKKRTLPVLQAYVAGKAGAQDVADSMWGAKDPLLRGLRRRRTWEKNMFTGHSSASSQDYGYQNAVRNAADAVANHNWGDGNTSISDDDSDAIDVEHINSVMPNPTVYDTPHGNYSPAAEQAAQETPAVAEEPKYAGLDLLTSLARMHDEETKIAKGHQLFDVPQQQKAEPAYPTTVFNLMQKPSPVSMLGIPYAHGGHLSEKGGENTSQNLIHQTDEDHYYTENGDPVEMIGWDDEGRKKFRDVKTGQITSAYAPSDNYGITAQDYSKAAKNYESSFDPNGAADFMNLATLGIGNRLMPSQDIGLVRDAVNGKINSLDDFAHSALIGNEGTGNPYANFAIDLAAPVAVKNLAHLGINY